MTQYSRFFGGPAGSVPEYGQPDFAEVLKRIFTNGIFASAGNALAVIETDPVSLAVKVDTGEGWIEGFWYQNTAALTKSLSEADPANPRIDRIVMRLDTATNFKISVEVLTGTPGAVPVAPSLTQTASTYEISLAKVYVDAGVTYVEDSDITDEREFTVAREVSAMPVGTVLPYAGSSAPDGYLICDGSAVSRSTYSNLFDVIGEIYGVGDGSTTFNIPDMRGNISVGYKSGDSDFGSLGNTGGEKTHTLIEAEMPAHTHSQNVGGTNDPKLATSSGSAPGRIETATGSTGGDGAHNNLQPYLVLNHIIKI